MFKKITDTIENALNDSLECAKGTFIPDISFIQRSLEELGFVISEVEIALSIPPRFSLTIDLDNSNVSDNLEDELTVLLEKIEESEDEELSTVTRILFKSIVKGLEEALERRSNFQIFEKRLSEIIIEGSIIPSVRLVYRTT